MREAHYFRALNVNDDKPRGPLQAIVLNIVDNGSRAILLVFDPAESTGTAKRDVAIVAKGQKKPDTEYCELKENE